MDTAIVTVATAAFLVGAVVIAYDGGARTVTERARVGLHVVVALAAALAYAVMAVGAGPAVAPRFLLWVVAAPGLLVALALAAMPAGRRDVGLAATLGLAGGLSFAALGIAALTAGVTHAVWFLVSVVVLAAALGVVWLPLREVAAAGHPVRREVFTALAGVTTVLLGLVPLVVLLSPTGVGVLGETAATAILAVIDVGLAVGTGLLAVWTAPRLAEAAEAERSGRPAPDGTAAFRAPTRRREDSGALREAMLRRAREEWARSRQRLAEARLALPRGSVLRGVAPAALARLRLPELGRPPRLLLLRGARYALIGRDTGAAPSAREGRPLAAAAGRPDVVTLGGYRYRLLPDEVPAARPEPAEPARPMPRFGGRTAAAHRPLRPAPWREGAERAAEEPRPPARPWFRPVRRRETVASAAGGRRRPPVREAGRLAPRAAPRFPLRRAEARPAAEPPAVTETARPPVAEARHRRPVPTPPPALELALLAARRAGLPTSLGTIPFRRIPPESTVAVAIVGGVLLWASRRR